jgi:uncharacterized membrane protein
MRSRPFVAFHNGLILLRLTVAITILLAILSLPYRASRNRGFTASRSTVNYTVQQIALPEAKLCVPSAVNSTGIVVGYGVNGDPVKALPFRWQAGNALLLPLPKDYKFGRAADINTSGQIVGTVWSDTKKPCAVLWEAGRVRELHTDDGFTTACAIRDDGVIVGSAVTTDGKKVHAVQWENGTLRRLGEFYAMDTNERGDVIGSIPGEKYRTRSLLYRNGTVRELSPLEGYSEYRAQTINDAGQIGGTAQSGNSSWYPIRWDANGKRARILDNREPGSVHGINRAGQAAGTRWILRENSTPDAVLYEKGQTIPLNDALQNGENWYLTAATGISDSGQIIGFGSYRRRSCGYLLTPLK